MAVVIYSLAPSHGGVFIELGYIISYFLSIYTYLTIYLLDSTSVVCSENVFGLHAGVDAKVLQLCEMV